MEWFMYFETRKTQTYTFKKFVKLKKLKFKSTSCSYTLILISQFFWFLYITTELKYPNSTNYINNFVINSSKTFSLSLRKWTLLKPANVVTLASAVMSANAAKLKPKPPPAAVPLLVDASAVPPALALAATAPKPKRPKNLAAVKKSPAALKPTMHTIRLFVMFIIQN